jgi:colanic acid biosynthesis glycosyl transferase WcaI
MGPKVLVIYQFFYPDDVVSSRHFSDLAEGLVKKGWDVSALTSNRICRDPKARIIKINELWRGIKIHRTTRPAFAQSSNLGRLLNSFWLISKWLVYLAKRPAFDAVILGTDPQFGYLMFPLLRFLQPKTKFIYWGFDLYPEAIIADGGNLISLIARAIRPITKKCYSKVDGMVDIGPCMRHILEKYEHHAECITLVPWALAEPTAPLKPNSMERKNLFGNAKLALLYSGTIGKAHEFECIIMLARELRRRNASVAFCFAGRGNMYNHLRSSVSDEDSNISFSDFASENQLEKRLSSGDIHILSLRPNWDGVVVPSKFFGSLAAGRPVVFEGSSDSSIRMWIEKYHLGYCLEKSNINEVADKLCALIEDPYLLQKMQQTSFICYHKYFSRMCGIEGWHSFLKSIINTAAMVVNY